MNEIILCGGYLFETIGDADFYEWIIKLRKGPGSIHPLTMKDHNLNYLFTPRISDLYGEKIYRKKGDKMNNEVIISKFMGKEVRDTITGFKGTGVAIVFYLTGCAQVCVRPKVNEDGELQKSHYFDHERLELTSKPKKKIKTIDPGGPQMDCPK